MTTDVERLIAQQRARLDGPEREVAAAVALAYLIARERIDTDLRLLLLRVQSATGDGETITDAWLRGESTYRRLDAQTRLAFDAFAIAAAAAIANGERAFSRAGQEDAQAQLVALDITPQPTTRTDGTRIDVLRGLFVAYGAALLLLIRRTVAIAPQSRAVPTMLTIRRAIEASAIETRQRATIRTQTMQAYRSGARQAMAPVASQLVGVRWVSALGPRACLACLSRHGTLHPVGYVMESHPRCRCTLQAVRLGDLAASETGEQWFAQQPVAFQQQRLGAAYDAYRDGRVTLADFTGIREHPIWGRSVQQRSATAVLRGVS